MITLAKASTLLLLFCRVLPILILPTLVFGQSKVLQSPTPNWVEQVRSKDLMPEMRKVTEGYYLKLLDYQLHAEQQTIYIHLVREIVAESGIQNGADIWVNFSPSYQKLTFHAITVIRNGQRLNRLDVNKFNVVATEQDASSFIYNGAHSAYLILDDVRVGDQIEYSYSIVGKNPVFEGRFFEDIYLQSTVPISQLHASVLVSPSRPLHVKEFNGAAKPTIQQANQLKRLLWEGNLIDAVDFEAYTPPWAIEFQYVQLSEYNDWEDVGDWAMRVNALPGTISGELKAKAKELLQLSNGNAKKFANSAIRFVQDEIRYTGVEIGEYSHKAHPPEKVFAQRYGDCKDKSLLLASILRHGGIEANLALVSTTLVGHIKEQQPSPYVFNHAIVCFTIDEKKYWADPTISHQGGDLDNRSVPKYGSALVLKKPKSEILPVPSNQSGQINCIEHYTLSDEDEALATLRVETSYSGHEADQIRAQLAYSSMWNTEKNYLDYYSKLYPEIESIDSLHVEDDRELNRITLSEHYRIPAFSVKNDAGQHEVSFYANMISDRLPELSGNRKTPIAVSYPGDIEYTINVVSPRGWVISKNNFFLDRNAYVFGASTVVRADTLVLNYQFKYHTSVVPASKSAEFAADIKKITNDHLGYTVSFNHLGGKTFGGGISWYAVLYTVVLLGALAFFGYRLYKKEVPPKIDAENSFIYQHIGGWLILPFIGFLITPIVVIAFSINNGFYEVEVWNAFRGTSQDVVFRLMVAFELTGNLVVFSLAIWGAVFMLKRKVLLPSLAIVYYLFNFGFVLIDFLALQVLGIPGTDYVEGVAEATRTFIIGAIWIPYFILSSRVRETFVNP